jgi:apolipoprotein N-acyltransferase
MLPYLAALCMLGAAVTPRRAFYTGLFTGLACIAPQLLFFWSIFGPVAVALWIILAIWTGFFVLLLRLIRAAWNYPLALLAAPFLWTGLEYFRSELYYLRFSWLNVGFAFQNSSLIRIFGVYGAGFIAMCAVVAVLLIPGKRRLIAASLSLAVIALFALAQGRANRSAARGPLIAGIQLEHASQTEILTALTTAVSLHPDADLFMLSEYSLSSPPTPELAAWCRNHQRYLLLGGIQPDQSQLHYTNTAFVIGPAGETLFSQGKSVPIQFFSDGLPAADQHLWDSPWGKIGICICYDLSYSRVTDRLIAQGAQALLVPTMDLESWGGHEHRLHALVAPARAAEYAVPIVRICSSGISQIVRSDGTIAATAGFPGQQEIIANRIDLSPRPHLPIDRWLAPASVGITGTLILLILAKKLRGRFWRQDLTAPRSLP